MRAPIARLLALAFAVSAVAAGCVEGTAGNEPQVATLMLHFPGQDTVLLDVNSGDVSSGPITIFDTTTFNAEFFASDGTPDERVTAARFRLDLAPVNPSIVTFTRGGAFSGTLNKLSGGNTQIQFTLTVLADGSNLFSRPVPISIN